MELLPVEESACYRWRRPRILFEAKARLEESLLLQRYSEYAVYVERVGRRFLPRPF